jgi:hypothetical protein
MFPVARTTGNRRRFGDSVCGASRWKSSPFRRLADGNRLRDSALAIAPQEIAARPTSGSLFFAGCYAAVRDARARQHVGIKGFE